MANPSKQNIRDAYRHWFIDCAPSESIAVTVTFKQAKGGRRVQSETARNAVRTYSRMLNMKAFGNKFKRRERQLTFIPVREGGTSPLEKHPHYHLLIEVPDGWTTAAWIDLAKEKLRAINCFGNQCDVKSVRDDGWLEYILKTQDKKSFADAIDAENLWVN